MKKKKINEIDVNAKTLNNLAPDYFDFRLFGLGANTNDVLPYVTDCNAILKTGFYTTNEGTLNQPDINAPYVLLNISRAPTYATQLLFNSKDVTKVYYRIKSNNIWSAWKQITML